MYSLLQRYIHYFLSFFLLKSNLIIMIVFLTSFLFNISFNISNYFRNFSSVTGDCWTHAEKAWRNKANYVTLVLNTENQFWNLLHSQLILGVSNYFLIFLFFCIHYNFCASIHCFINLVWYFSIKKCHIIFLLSGPDSISENISDCNYSLHSMCNIILYGIFFKIDIEKSHVTVANSCIFI